MLFVFLLVIRLFFFFFFWGGGGVGIFLFDCLFCFIFVVCLYEFVGGVFFLVLVSNFV